LNAQGQPSDEPATGTRCLGESEAPQLPAASSPSQAVISSFPRRRDLTADDYVAGVRGGDVAVLARALTLIESSSPRHQPLAEEVLTRLLPYTGRSVRLGITGAPGVGKSTFIEALGLCLLRGGRRVAVLAVDPSSGISGGSILGDKTRMTRLAADPAAYIRPSPSAGTLGGVARKTREAALVCEAAGFDAILIETVGVGQSETMVADMTDCFLALMAPGAGDELQAIKRGLLELVDVIAVNKADGPLRLAAEVSAQMYRNALEPYLRARSESCGRPGSPSFDHLPVVPTSARRGSSDPAANVPVVLTCSALYQEGIEAIWDAVVRRQDRLATTGELGERRRQQNVRWMWALVEDQLRQALHSHPAVRAIQDDLERQVLAGTTVAAAARRILEAFGIRSPRGKTPAGERAGPSG
jgi:LAO/AO transport system kinase